MRPTISDGDVKAAWEMQVLWQRSFPRCVSWPPPTWKTFLQSSYVTQQIKPACMEYVRVQRMRTGNLQKTKRIVSVTQWLTERTEDQRISKEGSQNDTGWTPGAVRLHACKVQKASAQRYPAVLLTPRTPEEPLARLLGELFKEIQAVHFGESREQATLHTCVLYVGEERITPLWSGSTWRVRRLTRPLKTCRTTLHLFRAIPMHLHQVVTTHPAQLKLIYCDVCHCKGTPVQLLQHTGIHFQGNKRIFLSIWN